MRGPNGKRDTDLVSEDKLRRIDRLDLDEI